MDNEQPIIKYNLMQHYFIQNKEIYEPVLCDLLNHSAMVRQFGSFSHIPKQSKGQPDAVSETGYEVDFKLLISEDMCEFRNLSQPKIQEISPGVICTSSSKIEGEQKTVVSLLNALRGMNEDKLADVRQKNDKISKAITHFFNDVISVEKNIMIFIPLYLNTVSDELSIQDKEIIISKELYDQNIFIYEFRKNNYTGYDTYLIYIEGFLSSWKQADFVISKFSETDLSIIDRVQMFSLNEVKQLYDYYDLI